MDRPVVDEETPTAAVGLRTVDLHKSFGPQVVLAGVDLEVSAGSLTAVLGPSGSGKTTFLRVVAGFERADRGTITLGGSIVEDDHHALPPEQRGIGYVPQEGSLFPHLTVAANVAFGMGRAAKRKRGASIDELMEMVGLGGMGRRYPHQLSGGQQQRVALARALAIRPALVLLDEPFSSLDAGLRASVRSDVQNVLRAGGMTAVLVTHDQDEALSMADQVAVIRDGVIGQQGTPQDLYDHPVDPAMARFLGNANLVPAVAQGERVDTQFGPMSIRSDGQGRSISGPVIALVRPEQLLVSAVPSGNGWQAVVRQTQFHGHDAVITLGSLDRPDADPVTVRTEGDLVLADGAEVEITVNGSAVVWSAAEHSSSEAIRRNS
jgi:iron(III) transport system ATP-binding protein